MDESMNSQQVQETFTFSTDLMTDSLIKDQNIVSVLSRYNKNVNKDTTKNSAYDEIALKNIIQIANLQNLS